MSTHLIASKDIQDELLRFTRDVNDLRDVDAILDKVLYETRMLTGAEGGSIFLIEEGQLCFSYLQNEILFSADSGNKHVYTDLTVPVNVNSIVGYAAMTGETLDLADVYQLPPQAPYTFNTYFDEQTGYRTQSLLTIPIKSQRGDIVGVLQLVNARDENKERIPFSPERKAILPLFTMNASVALERGVMTRELVLRMVRMAELRDPTETGAHVQRVGAFAAEIYNQWALTHGITEKERKQTKDLIRIAAMLHDVGKVGVSDMILNKPDTLTVGEFMVMRWHTVFGARLFAHPTSDLDLMARAIALHHHERWDGSGYPGRIENIHAQETNPGAPLKGEEIPLAARITALADVYDALCSKRVYKESWTNEQTVDYIRSQSHKHFDPEVVEAFLAIQDVIHAIATKFCDSRPINVLSLEGRVSA